MKQRSTKTMMTKRLAYGLDADVTCDHETGLMVVEIGPFWSSDIRVDLSRRSSGSFVELSVIAPGGALVSHINAAAFRMTAGTPRSRITTHFRLPLRVFQSPDERAEMHGNVLVMRLHGDVTSQ